MGDMASIDGGGKGYLTRDDVARAAAAHFGGDVPEICVDNMMRVADADQVLPPCRPPRRSQQRMGGT
jgi:hypothetical protein